MGRSGRASAETFTSRNFSLNLPANEIKDWTHEDVSALLDYDEQRWTYE